MLHISVSLVDGHAGIGLAIKGERSRADYLFVRER